EWAQNTPAALNLTQFRSQVSASDNHRHGKRVDSSSDLGRAVWILMCADASTERPLGGVRPLVPDGRRPGAPAIVRIGTNSRTHKLYESCCMNHARGSGWQPFTGFSGYVVDGTM